MSRCSRRALLLFALAPLVLAACQPPAADQSANAALPRPIINGTSSSDAAHEAILEMFYEGIGACTATLITDTVVLTAAHCVYVKDCEFNWETGQTENCQLETDPARFDFRTGTSARDGTRQTRRASAIHAHDAYDGTYLFNDIALLVLESPFDGVAPIPALPDRAPLAWSAADVGQPITYVGFGLTEHGTSGERLQVDGTADFICPGPNYCLYEDDTLYAPPRAVCGRMNEGGTCNGDSGGPMLLVREGVTYVAGVTSFGDGDCATFGCSTSVSSFADWIAARTGQALGDGEGCVDDAQCVSGFCAQGVCCDQRCDKTLCEACRASLGAPADGACAPIVTCPGESDCALQGVCDPASGECRHEAKPADTICDDGNACTLDDHCLFGACVGAGSVYCPPPNECQTPTTEDACQPENGRCAYDNLPDGTPCGEDQKSACQKGVCVSPKSEGSGCAATDSAPNASALAIVFLVTARLLNAPQRRKAWRRHEP